MSLHSFIKSLSLPPFLSQNTLLSTTLPIVLGLGSAALSSRLILWRTPANLKSQLGTNEDPIKARYRGTKRPPLSPPGWLFGPAWTLLYGLMGYASAHAWNSGTALSPPNMSGGITEATKLGAGLYSLQLFLNMIFMPISFGLGRPVLALVEILCLDAVVGWVTVVWFRDVGDVTAGWCMVPYCCWLVFATYLTAGTGYLNRWDTDVWSQKLDRAVDTKVGDGQR